MIATRDDIIAVVGAAEYAREASLARSECERDDYSTGDHTSLLVPHQISSLIWCSDVRYVERVALMFAVYDDIPCYAHLMYGHQHYLRFDEHAHEAWWRSVLSRLGGTDARITRPLLYSLWCDFFEDERTVSESWHALTFEEVPELVVQRVLEVSGPVPHQLKHSVFERLVRDEASHPALLKALVGGAFDVYGKLDVVHALKILKRLEVPEREELERLRRALEERVD